MCSALLSQLMPTQHQSMSVLGARHEREWDAVQPQQQVQQHHLHSQPRAPTAFDSQQTWMQGIQSTPSPVLTTAAAESSHVSNDRKRACNLCHNSKSSCSGEIPCDRCTRSHRAHLCQERPIQEHYKTREKRQRLEREAQSNAAAATSQSLRQQQREQHFQRQPHPSSSSSSFIRPAPVFPVPAASPIASPIPMQTLHSRRCGRQWRWCWTSETDGVGRRAPIEAGSCCTQKEKQRTGETGGSSSICGSCS